MKPREPRRSDFEYEEDYLEAVEDYERWCSDYEDRILERYYENKYG